MFGKFSIFTPTERELFRTNLLHPDKNYAYYIEDIIEIKYPNISKYGDTVPFNISEKVQLKLIFGLQKISNLVVRIIYPIIEIMLKNHHTVIIPVLNMNSNMALISKITASSIAPN